MGGSEAAIFTEAVLFFGFDAETVGYRVNAAAAKFSREVAAEMYGPHRPYGYLFGGSGGAYQTISSAENTTVWDGYVPFVLGNENSIPTAYSVRIHAQRILGPSGKFPCILDAVDPGGSGDPVGSCNLTEEQAGALPGSDAPGIPAACLVRRHVGGRRGPPARSPATSRSWILATPRTSGACRATSDTTTRTDRSRPARVIHNTTVVEKLTGPNRLVLATFPPASALTAIDLRILSGAGTGASQVGLPPGFVRAPGTNAGALTVTIPAFAVAIYNAVAVGDQVALDNSGYLALQTYQRHQIGGPEQAYYTYDQFRDPPAPGGTPIYPQRGVLTGPVGQYNGSGGHITGDFHGKMILQQSLMDPDAHPWGADWYKRRVVTVPGQARRQVPALLPGPCSARLGIRGRHVDSDRRLQRRAAAGPARPGCLGRAGRQASRQHQLLGGRRPGGGAAVAGAAQGHPARGHAAGQRAATRRRSVGQPVTLIGNDQGAARGGQGGEGGMERRRADGRLSCPWPFGDIRPVGVRVETTHPFTAPGTYFPVLRAHLTARG